MTNPGTTSAPSPAGISREARTSHQYNSDLLLSEADQKHAARAYPKAWPVLDHPALREAFSRMDQDANPAKRKSQKAGIWAVVLGVAALCAAAGSPLWKMLPDVRVSEGIGLEQVIAGLAALLGLAAALIGFGGVLYGTRKLAWLNNRLLCERLRQLHFQTFVWRLDLIAAACAGEPGREALERARSTWLEGLLLDHGRGLESELTAILDPHGASKVWLHETAVRGHPHSPAGFDTAELFQAYRTLRIEGQLKYCNHKLRTVGTVELSFIRLPLRRQLSVLRSMWNIFFLLLVLLHLFIIGGVFLASAPAAGAGSSHAAEVADVLVLWVALAALGIRTLQEGLSLDREIERYEEYRARLSELLTRFDTAADDAERLEVMEEVERAAFEEMRAFLRTHHEAQFVL